VARVDITPEGPIWLSGYGARTHPSTGVVSRLSAKALAIEDTRRRRVVIVTTDLIGLPRAITDPISARLAKEHGLERANIVFNSSHTHTGPVVKSNLPTMFDLQGDARERVDSYGRALSDKLYGVATAALGDLAPAQLSFSAGETGFAMNRRKPAAGGRIQLADNPQGPVDHAVPVLRVIAPDGKLKAILFGYACHNTTLTGEFYDISADYAGFAQAAIEEQHAGATALFFLLCAGDQNPSPRSTLAYAQQHGKELAAAVEQVLSGAMDSLRGQLRAVFELVDLNFAPHTREQFETDLNNKNSFVVRRARAMLKAYDERHPVRSIPYPVQAVRLGNGPVLLALGGEVVIDYDLRVKREYPGEKLMVGGYSNDVMCYIPSLRVLREGGYEAVDSMIYYGQPGPFAEDVEERVMGSIHRVLKRVGAKTPKSM